MAVAWQHPWEDLQGQMRLYGAMERAPGEEGGAGVPGSCWQALWLTSPAWMGQARWEQQLCRLWETCELYPCAAVPRDGGAGSAQHETKHSQCPDKAGEPGLHMALLLLLWHQPQDDPTDNSSQLTAHGQVAPCLPCACTGVPAL